MNQRPILLVEDNASEIKLTQRAFAKCNIANPVVVAEDGQAALDYLLAAQPGELPILVLLDLNLPMVDGLEVLRRIRAEARTRFVPVVVLTTSREQRDLERSYALGANSYVRKPIDFTQFSETVARLGIYWTALNELPPGTET